ncbi:MAG: sensor histidine kinase [Candidatus Hermodarchaeota archaeon]
MQELEMENMYQKAYIRVKTFKGLFTHDISNLFHTISNSLELCQMLLKDGIETEEILEYFKLIEEQINRGKKLVKNIRNLSELEESEMPLEPIDIFETLKNAVHYIRTNFSNRSVNIQMNSETERIYVLANELLLDVFENIMMNSIIYNRNENVQIEVSITEVMESGRQFIQLEFKDNGIGIDDTRKKEILQENPKKSKNSRGMGLGLSLTAKLIDLYEGRMWIEDRIKGDSSKGSNFVILIPKTTHPELSFYAFSKEHKNQL